MEAALEINGTERLYPKEINDLENLLLFLMDHEIPEEELIVEVKVDGETYCEGFKHQARELYLEDLETIAVATQTKKVFAKSFVDQAPHYLAQVKQGVHTAACLLREPHDYEQGNELLARSLEVLRAFKNHCENVDDVLQEEGESRVASLSWKEFDSTADRIIDLQERRDFAALSDLLEGELERCLAVWIGIVDQNNG